MTNLSVGVRLSTDLPEALVAAFARHGRPVRAVPGQTLVSPDLFSTHVYQVVGGRVQVVLLSSGGRRVILREMAEGDLFGELEAIDLGPRSATVVALESCLLTAIPGSVFCETMFGAPDLAEWLARRLVARVRYLNRKVFELNLLPVAARLHCEILRLSGVVAGDRDRPVIEPAPTHAQFAERIGSHREAVTREIGYLAARKIIDIRGRRLTVFDLPGLARLVRAAADPLEPGVAGAGGAAADL